MIRQTYIVAENLGNHRRRDDHLREARIGTDFSAVVDDIIGGQYEDVVAVYKLEGERIEDMSSEVCAEILKYAEKGNRLGHAAGQFLDQQGFDIPNREEAA